MGFAPETPLLPYVDGGGKESPSPRGEILQIVGIGPSMRFGRQQSYKGSLVVERLPDRVAHGSYGLNIAGWSIFHHVVDVQSAHQAGDHLVFLGLA